MSKEEDLAFLKMHFTSFGEGVLEQFQKQYTKKGMSFTQLLPEAMCDRLSAEIEDFTRDVYHGVTSDISQRHILYISSILFMLYINMREKA